MSRALHRVAVVLVAVVWLACGARDETQHPSRPLEDLLGSGRVLTETFRVEPALAADRPRLLEGWERPVQETSRAPQPTRPSLWVVEDTAALEWQLLEPRAVELDIDVRPNPRTIDPGASQALTLAINGTRFEPVTLREGRQTVRVPTDAGAWQEGFNRVELRFARRARPNERDPRELAAAVFSISDASSVAAATVQQVEGSEERIVLPVGARVDFGVELQEGATLEIDALAGRGSASALLVRVQLDEPTAVFQLEIGASSRPQSFALAPRAGPARIELRARGEGTGALVLRGSRVTGLTTAPPTPTTQFAAAPASADPRPPHIVLYLVDTLRADRLGVYGSTRGLTPHTDAFAESATTFMSTSSQSSWTRASVATLFSGLYPFEHGANRRTNSLTAEHVTLAEALGSAGYDTAAFVTNPNVTPGFGMTQGFDHFWFEQNADSDVVNEEVVGYLESRGASRKPVFLYVHTIDPHAPYDPPRRFRRRLAPSATPQDARRSLRTLSALQDGRVTLTPELLEKLESLYDAEVAFNDESFGALLGELDRRLGEDTVTAFVSDHGEEFGEHGGWQHGRTLLQESVHVPLIVRFPPSLREGLPPRVAQPTDHLDLVQVLRQVVSDPAGLGPLLESFGRSERLILTYLYLDGAPRLALRQGSDKAVFRAPSQRLDRDRLFNLARDPREAHDESLDRGARLTVLRTWAQERLDAGLAARLDATGADVEIDEEMRRNLEALGYLGGP